MKNFIILSVTLICLGVGGWIYWASIDAPENEAQPLYWVAPMDDSYRRDKPGKSPMGMDLIPVYADSKKDKATPLTGEVMISPSVQHNMGVKFATADVAPLNMSVSALGNVSFNEDHLIHIHPRVEGWIETLYVKTEGEKISKGQKLYTLYSPQLVNAQEEYVIALKRGDKRLADSAKQRLKALHLSSGFVEALERTHKISHSVTFYAPQDGVVEHLSVREGFYIQPGTTVLSIANLDSVWVKVDVFEHQANRVFIGQKASLTLDYMPRHTWYGEVDYIYPELNSATRTLSLRITLDNSQRLFKPNMFANVTLHSRSERPVVRIPYQAVIQMASQDRVVVTDTMGRFKSVEVVTGRRDKEYIEIVEGILPGDKVVVSAQFLIDSESSKSADFARMAEPDNQATVNGIIQAVTLPDKVTIQRDAIEKWGRPAATVDFIVSPHINLSQFNVHDPVRFTFVVNQQFTIVDMHKHESVDRQHTLDSHKGMTHD